MYISLREHDFPDKSYQVAFMLSHLKGSALEWFQSAVSHRNTSITSVAWLSSLPAFLNELRRLFGLRNPTNDAIICLENLRYKDSGKAVKYTLDFNRDAPRTGWNENTLYRQFYKGLPDRLKDELARIGKPATLIQLQHQIQTLDQCHWERQPKSVETSVPPQTRPPPASLLLEAAAIATTRLLPQTLCNWRKVTQPQPRLRLQTNRRTPMPT